MVTGERFLQITADDAIDLAVPGQKYTFGVVKAAQALVRALVEAGLRVATRPEGSGPPPVRLASHEGAGASPTTGTMWLATSRV